MAGGCGCSGKSFIDKNEVSTVKWEEKLRPHVYLHFSSEGYVGESRCILIFVHNVN